MAFDFPASPTDGQEYNPSGGPDYIWRATDGNWQIKTSGTNSAYVAKGGDTMTGLLILSGNAAAALGAATKQQVDAKEPTITAGNTAQYWRGDKSWQTLDKASVGLANVDNTSDANKPVSTAQNNADLLRVLKAGDTMTGFLTINVSAPTTAGLLNIRPNAGAAGYITFTESGVLDKWGIGCDAGSGTLNFRQTNATGTVRLTLGSAGELGLTGDLNITGAGPTLRLKKTASTQVNWIAGATGEATRWIVRLGDEAPETGGNAGSNFAIERWNDASSAALGQPLVISRATGKTLLGNDVAVLGTTPSTSTTTGALTAAGGVGVQGALNVGTNITLGAPTVAIGTRINAKGTADSVSPIMTLQPLAATAGAKGIMLLQGPNDNTDTTSIYVDFWDYGGNVRRGSISRNAGNVAYNVTSDERLKTVQGRTSRGLKELMEIFVPDYTMGDDKVTQGLLAQKLHAIYPEAVTVGGDDPHKEPWSIDYGRLTPLIIAAVQDFVNDTNARLERLEQQR
jgi:hypothetical protein